MSRLGRIVATMTGRALRRLRRSWLRSEEHTSELQSQSKLVCRLLLEKKAGEAVAHPRLHRPSEPEPRPAPASSLGTAPRLRTRHPHLCSLTPYFAAPGACVTCSHRTS